MRPTPVPFTLWLPVFSVAIWLAIFAVPVTLNWFSLNDAAHGGSIARIVNGPFEARVQRSHFLSFAAMTASMQVGHTVSAIDMPGLFGEVAVSLPIAWPQSYRPAHMMLDEWRCLSLPLFCLPAWWFAGAGIDGLLGRRRVHWATMGLGATLSILLLVLLLGLRFGTDASDRADDVWPLWGLGLWAALFALVPLAWLRARRADRKIAESQAEEIKPREG